MKTSELIGTALDWAVSEALGLDWYYPEYGDSEAKYSTDWTQGGPIIEREQISIVYDDAAWRADPDMMGDINQRRWGETPLVAAMRCYVASVLGDEIEIPDELK